MKVLRIIGIVLAVLIVVLLVGKNIIVKTAVTTGVKVVTGLNLSIDKMKIGLINTLVAIDGLKLYNPKGFEDPIMVDIPEIYVDYDLGAFFKKQVHLQEVRLHLKEFVVAKNKDGQLNLDSLKTTAAPKAAEEKKEAPKKEKGEAPQIKIDVLKLKIDKVYYKDYSKGGEPSVQEYNVNIDAAYENITNPQALVSLIVVKALANTTISSLANFDLGPLAEGLKGGVKDAGAIISGLAGNTLEMGKNLGGKTGNIIKNTTDKIKKLLPFGGD